MKSNDKNVIGVLYIQRDVQTDDVKMALQTSYLGKDVTVTVNREDVTVKGFQELRGKGFPVMTKKEAECIILDIFDDEENVPLKEVFHNVGWHTINGVPYFFLKKALCDRNIEDMEYNGCLNLDIKGKLKKSVEFYNENIVNSDGLQAIVAVSLTSALVGMIAEKDLKFIFHIEGTSTTGKTTSLMLAGSVWGNPKIAPNGIIKNWNTTDNKLINSVGGNNGIPVGLDELSMSNANITQLTYLLTGGIDKQRMNDENTVDNEFRTIFLSTGEIQFKNSNFGGIGVRLIEVKDYNFTETKEKADLITEFIQQNYGIIGFEFARNLTKYSSDYMKNKIEEYSEKVIKRLKSHAEKQGIAYSPLFSRLAEKIATVLVAAQFAKKKLGIQFDIKAIADFLICQTTVLENGQEQAVVAMEKFMEEYNKNQKKFPVDEKGQNIWGKVTVKNRELTEIIVLYNQFVQMMKKVGFPDTSSLIKALKEKNFIKCEKDKNYSRRNVGDNKKAKVIVIDVLALNGGADDED